LAWPGGQCVLPPIVPISTPGASILTPGARTVQPVATATNNKTAIKLLLLILGSYLKTQFLAYSLVSVRVHSPLGLSFRFVHHFSLPTSGEHPQKIRNTNAINATILTFYSSLELIKSADGATIR
jgi:hypothetical protein